jgi:hypothetical protein
LVFAQSSCAEAPGKSGLSENDIDQIFTLKFIN